MLSRPTERVVAFYNKRGTAEQWIKEGKNEIKWTRMSCRKFRNNEVQLQLHALAYNLGNFSRTLALPKELAHWSLTTLREKLVKIGAKVVSHGRYITFAKWPSKRWHVAKIRPSDCCRKHIATSGWDIWYDFGMYESYLGNVG